MSIVLNWLATKDQTSRIVIAELVRENNNSKYPSRGEIDCCAPFGLGMDSQG